MIDGLRAWTEQRAYDRAYQQGRADKYQEITSEHMLLTEKQVAEIRADAIEEFVRPILNGTLHTICRMIASGDIPKDVYQKWLSDTPIGFMTPLEIYAEILNEQLKEQSNE